MSDWEIVKEQPIKKYKNIENDWEIVPEKNSEPKESFSSSLVKAPFRVGGDILGAGMNLAKNIPSYFEQSKSELPGIFDVIRQHPKHAAQQALAGGEELANNLLNLPLGLAKYGSNRLNILPQSVPNTIEKYTPSGFQNIEQDFGEPKYPGEALIRGSIRNIPQIAGGGKLASVLNPMKYTSKNIAKNIVNEESRQVKAHSKEYGNIWKEAEKSGFNEVPANLKSLSNNLKTIKKYKSEKEYGSLNDFISKPTLQNAQKAQSDLGAMSRALEKKSRKGSLTSEESKLMSSAIKSEKHIEENMFKNKSGKINDQLRNRYKDVTKSYRENVVPYRYNKNIQAYKNNEMLASELRKNLSKGEFAAKKGSEHPELFLGKKLKKLTGGAAVLGGLYGGKKIYDID